MNYEFLIYIDFKNNKIKITQAVIRASKHKKNYIAPTKLKDTKNTSSEREATNASRIVFC